MSRAVVDYTGSKAAPEITFPAGFDLNSGSGVNRLDSVLNPRDNNTDEITGGFNVNSRPLSTGWPSRWARSSTTTPPTRSCVRRRALSCRTPAADTTSANNIVVAQVPCATIEGIINTNSTTNDFGFTRPAIWASTLGAVLERQHRCHHRRRARGSRAR